MTIEQTLLTYATTILKITALICTICFIFFSVKHKKMKQEIIETTKKECSLVGTQISDFIDYKGQLCQEIAEIKNQNWRYKTALNKLKDNETDEIERLIDSIIKKQEEETEAEAEAAETKKFFDNDDQDIYLDM